MELLVRCLRAELRLASPHGSAHTRRQNLDWCTLVRLGRQHGILPFLHRYLATHSTSDVPSSVLERLSRYVRRNTQRNLGLAGELTTLVQLLQKGNVPVLPWKGPALSAYLYENLALRQSLDLDVLVSDRNVLRALELLGARGYRPDFAFTDRQMACHLRSNYAISLRRESGPVVELHWKLVPPPVGRTLPFEAVWCRRGSFQLAGTSIPVPAPEDLLLALCLHGTKHRWERLIWVYDVAQILYRHPALDWAAVLKRAHALQARRSVLLGLWLAHDIFTITLPPIVRDHLTNCVESRCLGTDIRNTLYRGRRPSQKVWERYHFYLHIQPSRKLWAHCVARTCFVPRVRDWSLFRLPDRLFMLYYVLRPLRLLVKYGAKLVAWVFRRYLNG